MLTKWIVAYSQYGNWYTTLPFPDKRSAEEHADRHLRGQGNEHKTHVQFLQIEIDPNAEQNRQD